MRGIVFAVFFKIISSFLYVKCVCVCMNAVVVCWRCNELSVAKVHMPVKWNFRWIEGKSHISIERIAWHLFALCQFLSSTIKHLFMWCITNQIQKKKIWKNCWSIYHFGIENEMIRSRWQIELIWVKWDGANRRQNVKIINLFSIKLKMKLVECFIIN